MDNFTPPLYFEYFALLLWGISGAIVGWRKGYDVVGVFVIAFVSSFGGGLLRDGLFLQRLPAVLIDPNYIFILIVAVAGVTVVGRRLNRDRLLPRVVSVIDAAGVPMFVVIGAELARVRGLELPAIILVATVSGVGGGLMRDLMAGDTPELLRPGQYNTLLVVLSALLYMALVEYTPLDRTQVAWITIGLFFLARLLTIRFNWRTRPLSDFHVTEVVDGVTEWLPWGRKK
jgi:uncharacterized membrane protein YeiH